MHLISPEELGSSFYFSHGFAILGTRPFPSQHRPLCPSTVMFTDSYPQVSLPGEALPGEACCLVVP